MLLHQDIIASIPCNINEFKHDDDVLGAFWPKFDIVHEKIIFIKMTYMDY